MNSQENIIDTIKILDGSNQMLHANASLLVQLSKHSIYGERICSILDGIQVEQNKIIELANELLDQYEERYGKEIDEVDDLTAQLLEEMGETNAR